MRKILRILLLLPLCAVFAHAAATSTQITAKFTYDDGTPVAATATLYQDDATNAVVASQALDAAGKVSISVPLDPALQYRVQFQNTTVQRPFPFYLKSMNIGAAVAQMIINTLPTIEIDIVLAKADDSLVSWKTVPLQVNTVAPIALKLSICPLSGPSGATLSSGAWKNTQVGSTWSCAIQVPTAGSYTITMTVGRWGSGSFHFEDPKGTAVGKLLIPDTGSFTASLAVTAKLALPAGSSTLLIVADTCCQGVLDGFTLQMP